MPQNSHVDETNDFFNTKKIADVVIIKFNDNIFDTTKDLKKRDVILHYLERVSRCETIKTIIIDSSMETCGNNEYLEFFLNSDPEGRRDPYCNQDHFGRNNAIAKYCNVINQVILKVADLDKFVIHVCKGSMIPVVLSMSLACDYRIVADNTVFQNTYLDLGITPKGGSPFFLSRMLGRSRAYEILLLKKEIDAHEAMKYGIVDQVVPVKELEKTALETARRFGNNHANSISGIKKLVNWSVRDLADYLEFENLEIGTLVRSPEFEGHIITFRDKKRPSDFNFSWLE